MRAQVRPLRGAWTEVTMAKVGGWRVKPHRRMGTLKPLENWRCGPPSAGSRCPLCGLVHRGGLGELVAYDACAQVSKVISLKSCLPFTRKGPKQESLTEALPPRLEHW